MSHGCMEAQMLLGLNGSGNARKCMKSHLGLPQIVKVFPLVSFCLLNQSMSENGPFVCNVHCTSCIHTFVHSASNSAKCKHTQSLSSSFFRRRSIYYGELVELSVTITNFNFFCFSRSSQNFNRLGFVKYFLKGSIKIYQTD